MSEAHNAESTVFISYSHKDEKEKDALVSHLGVLAKEGLVNIWIDDEIGAGGDWGREISQAIAKAKVAILLITANFLTSDFILSREVPKLLKRRELESITVFPVIAKACAWQRVTWLNEMNVRPKNGKPVWGDQGSHVDEDLTVIAIEVVNIIEKANIEIKKSQKESRAGDGRFAPDEQIQSPPLTLTSEALPSTSVKEATQHPTSQGKYNTVAVRTLLTEAFSDEEFTIFCYDHFRPVHRNFSVGMSSPNKMQLLIEYCDRNNLFSRLLSLVNEINPIKYASIGPYVVEPISVQRPPATPPSLPEPVVKKEKPSPQELQAQTSPVPGMKPITGLSPKEVARNYLEKMKPVPPDSPQLYMAPYLVSNELYYHFVQIKTYWDPIKGACKTQGDVDVSYLAHWADSHPRDQDRNLPVTNISFRAAQAFADWLSEISNHEVRLPTPEEWQIAASARRPNWFDEEIQAGRVNYFRRSFRPHAVDAYGANPFDIHDLLGNAYDMCISPSALSAERLLLVGGCYHSTKPQLKEHKNVKSEKICLPDASFRCVRNI